MRTLIIEDEEALADAMARGLRLKGMAVDVALDGVSGYEKAVLNDYDVVVLDRNLPGMHGDEVCRRLAASDSTARILMLTAAHGPRDRVAGLDLGADDYLGKPFDFDELVARMRALARRAGPARPPLLRRQDVELDPASRDVRRGGRRLELTNKEFGVLEVLLAARGRSVSAEELLERIWDENADPFTAAVKITISRLRTKLGPPQVIRTVARSGYQIGEGA